MSLNNRRIHYKTRKGCRDIAIADLGVLGFHRTFKGLSKPFKKPFKDVLKRRLKAVRKAF
jgi:NCAIR mutase (PurE)-related protein